MNKRISLYICAFICIAFTQTKAASMQVNAISSKQAETGVALKDLRKVGVGFHVSGPYGALGAQMDLNFSQEFTASVGFGLGDGFNTFNFQVKRVIRGENLLPYGSLGFAKWSTNQSGENKYSKTSPGFLADKFLSGDEKNGMFSEDIFYPGVGIQYLISRGQWAGTSLFAELNLLVDLDKFNSAAVGSLGYMYYF